MSARHSVAAGRKETVASALFVKRGSDRGILTRIERLNLVGSIRRPEHVDNLPHIRCLRSVRNEQRGRCVT
jgi:hypothetical protein